MFACGYLRLDCVHCFYLLVACVSVKFLCNVVMLRMNPILASSQSQKLVCPGDQNLLRSIRKITRYRELKAIFVKTYLQEVVFGCLLTNVPIVSDAF